MIFNLILKANGIIFSFILGSMTYNVPAVVLTAWLTLSSLLTLMHIISVTLFSLGFETKGVVGMCSVGQ